MMRLRYQRNRTRSQFNIKSKRKTHITEYLALCSDLETMANDCRLWLIQPKSKNAARKIDLFYERDELEGGGGGKERYNSEQ